jgi:hypothetical protein
VETCGGNEDVEGVKAGALQAVNDYFQRRLVDVPAISTYLGDLHARDGRPA